MSSKVLTSVAELPRNMENLLMPTQLVLHKLKVLLPSTINKIAGEHSLLQKSRVLLFVTSPVQRVLQPCSTSRIVLHHSFPIYTFVKQQNDLHLCSTYYLHFVINKSTFTVSLYDATQELDQNHTTPVAKADECNTILALRTLPPACLQKICHWDNLP